VRRLVDLVSEINGIVTAEACRNIPSEMSVRTKCTEINVQRLDAQRFRGARETIGVADFAHADMEVISADTFRRSCCVVST
jgi:hypothetical protein